MITYQDKIVQNITKQFDGMSKIEVYDILQKIESLLLDFNTPIQFKEIKNALETSSRKNNVTAVDEYGYCYLDDCCQYLNIYKIKSLFPTFLGGESLYFTIPGQYELIHYDNRNIEEAFSNMHLEPIVSHFLKYNPVKKRNPKTKRLLLLELFDQIDP
ncbi:hypothetical protein [Aquimarina algiphila]|uniref:hypothetical protein n=1 Tax=Aquimarina algiphila TaxID=2047982 RepID=UPI00232C893C|nr:hypothetical protein [Aquimarina algiphila]